MGRKPWKAVWYESLGNSPKWTKLTMAQRGFWHECMRLCKADGRLELKPGFPLTDSDFAYEFRMKRTQIQKYQDALVRVGLAEWQDDFFALTNVKAMGLGREPAGTPRGRGGDAEGKTEGKRKEKRPRQTSNDNGLGDNTDAPIEDKRVEEKIPKGFEACWALVEMKTDRKKALLRWQGKLPLCDKKKHRLEPLADIILAALVRLKAHRDHLLKADEFVPAPKGGDSWIYGMRWEDEIPEHAQHIPLEDRPRVAAPGEGHPAYLKPPGEWKDNGFVHRVSKSFFYEKSRTDGTVVESEQLPTRYS